MNLTPLVPQPITPIAAPFQANAMPLMPAVPTVSAGVLDRPARAAAGSAPAQAVSGMQLVSTPIVDFPGVVAGAKFVLAKGSKVGFFGVKGDADVLAFSDDNAAFHIKAGKFGMKVDVKVDVTRIDDTHVKISSTGSGIPSMTATGEIVRSERNYAEFRDVEGKYKNTVISRDGAGVITIDAEVPTFGGAHLVLAPR